MPDLFAYSWHVDKTRAYDNQSGSTHIRIYCLDEENKTVCVRVNDFTPYVYIELHSTDEEYLESATQAIIKQIKEQPVIKYITHKKKLYFAHKETHPFLFLAYKSEGYIRKLVAKLSVPIKVNGTPCLFRAHETRAGAILQLATQRKLKMAGWLTFPETPQVRQKVTHAEREYIVPWKSLSPCQDSVVNAKKHVLPLVMSFDIEVNSDDPGKFPKAGNPKDCVFQISCIFHRENPDREENVTRVLLTLGSPGKYKETYLPHTRVISFPDEEKLLLGFTSIIQEYSPQICSGYNIMGFDLDYMIKRAEHHGVEDDFGTMSMVIDQVAEPRSIEWSSSAYKHQKFKILDVEGRIWADLFPIVSRDYKFSTYTLNFVSEKLLKDKKKDLPATAIFKCYRAIQEADQANHDLRADRAEKACAVCGSYCEQDTFLVTKLYEKIKVWAGQSEMATVCNVPIPALYLRGQQLRVYSQLYFKCTHANIVVEEDVSVKESADHYMGAKVFDPIPGVYDNVLPFDFASLYPSTMMAYNICPSTAVMDDSVPDELVHTIEWDEHIGCPHDPRVIELKEINDLIAKEHARLLRLRVLRDASAKTIRSTFTPENDEERTIIDEIAQRGKKGESATLKVAYASQSTLLKSLIHRRQPINKVVKGIKWPLCGHRKFRFLKEPMGVLPTLLKDLLDARKQTRGVLKTIEKEMETCQDASKLKELQMTATVLDKRQLAYKVSANSGYGLLGVRENGMLPFMPGAMCTTAKGRENITKVAKVVQEKYGGKLIYGDTDSNYVWFECLEGKSAKEKWDFALRVADEISRLFPKPIKLEFEGKIYTRFAIWSKKRYLSEVSNEKGEIDPEIGKKGVLLARRDNSPFVRSVYEKVIMALFDKSCTTLDELVCLIMTCVVTCLAHGYATADFVVTQSVGSIGETDESKLEYMRPDEIQKTPKGQIRGKIGSYSVEILPSDEAKWQKKMKNKKVEWQGKNKLLAEREYYMSCLPPQVQLALRLGKRGKAVAPGTRLEYVVSDVPGATKKYEKLESYEYFCSHASVLRIDYLYYIEQLINPLDEIFQAIHKRERIMHGIHAVCVRKRNVVEELKSLFTRVVCS